MLNTRASSFILKLPVILNTHWTPEEIVQKAYIIKEKDDALNYIKNSNLLFIKFKKPLNKIKDENYKLNRYNCKRYDIQHEKAFVYK